PVDLARFRSRNAANSSQIRLGSQNSLLTGNFLQFNREFASAEKQPCRRIGGCFGIEEVSFSWRGRDDTPGYMAFSFCSIKSLRHEAGKSTERSSENAVKA